ncbi:MAG: hypothetical protein WD042_09425 [Phycisphaeraceae bacterium]
MPWALLQSVGLVLLLLAYLLATCMLSVLAAQRKHAVDMYDRIRESKRLRRAYLESLAKRLADQAR